MAAVLPTISYPKGPELQRTRYTPYAPGFIGVDAPDRAQQLQHELDQAPGRRTGHNEIATLWAQYSHKVQHSASRFSPQPAAAGTLQASRKTLTLPSHTALAAKLSEAAARQKRKLQQRRNANVWTTHLAADVAAVCDEVRLPAAAARALAAAALRRQISANPGVLLCQLVRLLPLEQQLWGHGSLAHILSSRPQLVQYDPDTLKTNLAAVRQAQGSSRAVAAVKRYPQLLTCTPYRLQSNISKLQDMLGFDSAAAAAAACVRQPLLLLSSSDSLLLRWQQLQQLVPAVDQELLAKQLRRNPETLLMRPSTIMSKMVCLQQLFDLCEPASAATAAVVVASNREKSRQKQQLEDAAAEGAVRQTPVQDDLIESPAAAAAVVGREDDFISWNHAEQDAYELPELSSGVQQEVAVKLAQLKAATAQLQQRQQHLQLQQQQKPQQQQRQQQLGLGKSLLSLQRHQPPAHTSSSKRSRSSGCCDPRVQHLVLKTPALLALTPQTLQHHVIELQLLLGLQADDGQLQRMVLLQPGLLTQSPATLANKVQLLQYLTCRGESDIQEMVIRCPAVLTLSVANITRKWGVLQKCVSKCKAWKEQLRDAANVTVAMALCYSVERLQRLEYVVQDTRQGLDSSGSKCSGHDSSGTAISTSSSRSGCQNSTGVGCSSKTAEAVHARALPYQEQQQQHQQRRNSELLHMKLAVVPWRSLLQVTDQAFCKRYPGYKVWLQQQTS